MPIFYQYYEWFRNGFATRLLADPGDGSRVQGIDCLEGLQRARSELVVEGPIPTWEQVLQGVKPAEVCDETEPGDTRYGWQAVVTNARKHINLDSLL